MEKLNIAEILRHCQSGMELDCTICDNVYFDSLNINENLIYCYTKDTEHKPLVFYADGTYIKSDNAKCVIFPKGKTTWEGFQRPFKDGDILAYDNKFAPSTIFIYRYDNPSWNTSYFVGLSGLTRKFYKDASGALSSYEPNVRFATEKEKQKLFDAIKANGYKWNPETKTLEKLEVNKFDITTLKPFESRVLVRSGDNSLWKPAIFGCYVQDAGFFALGGTCWMYCIPFENNEHLLSTTDNCDEYYKTWK